MQVQGAVFGSLHAPDVRDGQARATSRTVLHHAHCQVYNCTPLADSLHPPPTSTLDPLACSPALRGVTVSDPCFRVSNSFQWLHLFIFSLPHQQPSEPQRKPENVRSKSCICTPTPTTEVNQGRYCSKSLDWTLTLARASRSRRLREQSVHRRKRGAIEGPPLHHLCLTWETWAPTDVPKLTVLESKRGSSTTIEHAVGTSCTSRTYDVPLIFVERQ